MLLREIIRLLKGPESVERLEVAITASTGIAGLNIGGSTIHSWAGIGLGKESKEDLAEHVMSKEQPRKRWSKCKTLILDEGQSSILPSVSTLLKCCVVSMLDGTLFDKLVSINFGISI